MKKWAIWTISLVFITQLFGIRIVRAVNTYDCVWSGASCIEVNRTCQAGFTPDCNTRTVLNCVVLQQPCIPIPPTSSPFLEVYDPRCGNGGVKTALGCLPTDPEKFVNLALPWAVGLGSGIAFFLGLYGAFMIVISAGNPEKMQAGRELITSAIAGLLIIIFAVFILRTIGVDILQLFGSDKKPIR